MQAAKAWRARQSGVKSLGRVVALREREGEREERRMGNGCATVKLLWKQEAAKTTWQGPHLVVRCTAREQQPNGKWSTVWYAVWHRQQNICLPLLQEQQHHHQKEDQAAGAGGWATETAASCCWFNFGNQGPQNHGRLFAARGSYTLGGFFFLLLICFIFFSFSFPFFPEKNSSNVYKQIRHIINSNSEASAEVIVVIVGNRIRGPRENVNGKEIV